MSLADVLEDQDADSEEAGEAETGERPDLGIGDDGREGGKDGCHCQEDGKDRGDGGDESVQHGGVLRWL